MLLKDVEDIERRWDSTQALIELVFVRVAQLELRLGLSPNRSRAVLSQATGTDVVAAGLNDIIGATAAGSTGCAVLSSIAKM